jgi:hypothetical protein
MTQNPTDVELAFIPMKPIMDFSQLVHWWGAGSLWPQTRTLNPFPGPPFQGPYWLVWIAFHSGLRECLRRDCILGTPDLFGGDENW